MLLEARREEKKKRECVAKITTDEENCGDKFGELLGDKKDISLVEEYVKTQFNLPARPKLSLMSASRISQLPSLYFLENWISKEEEAEILKIIEKSPKECWVRLKTRQLQNWGGIVGSEKFIAEPLPVYLQQICHQLHSSGAFPVHPNHVLLNRYTPGQGILPHTDGIRYHPFTATLSLGSSGVMKFYRNHQSTKDVNGHTLSVFLPRRSLLLFTDELYSSFLHSIPEVEADVIDSKIVNKELLGLKEGDTIARNTRISLTIRYVT